MHLRNERSRERFGLVGARRACRSPVQDAEQDAKRLRALQLLERK